MTAVGTFAEVAAQAPQHAGLLKAIQSFVLRLHPEAVEVSRPGEKSVCWGWGPKKMSEAYAYAIPHSRHVNLGFFCGADLDDPEGLMKGTGKALRHVSLTDEAQLANPALEALVIAASEERRVALASSKPPAR